MHVPRKLINPLSFRSTVVHVTIVLTRLLLTPPCRSQRVLTSSLCQNLHDECFHISRYFHEENPYCELFIIRTYSKSSLYRSRFECERTTTLSVSADSLFFFFYAALLNVHGSEVALSIFIRRKYFFKAWNLSSSGSNFHSLLVLIKG